MSNHPDPATASVDPGDDISDAVVNALDSLGEALETTERARGHLYSFHQLTGHADLLLDDAVTRLRAAGHDDLADAVDTELVGRNVLPGRWTFQIVEEYDDGYYQSFRDLEHRARQALADGRRHLHEARMKQHRRTPGIPAALPARDNSPGPRVAGNQFGRPPIVVGAVACAANRRRCAKKY